MPSEKSFPQGQAVRIVCLSSKLEACGILLEQSGNRLTLRSEQSFGRDAAIKISWPGFALLCDVASCRAEGGDYFLGALLHHTIRALPA